jgi:hypothetical protein
MPRQKPTTRGAGLALAIPVVYQAVVVLRLDTSTLALELEPPAARRHFLDPPTQICKRVALAHIAGGWNVLTPFLHF